MRLIIHMACLAAGLNNLSAITIVRRTEFGAAMAGAMILAIHRRGKHWQV